MLHGSNDIPTLTEDYLRVGYNKMLNVAVTPKQIKTSKEVAEMAFDERECYLLHEKTLKYFNFYSVSNCELECLTNITLLHCNCVLPHMPSKWR